MGCSARLTPWSIPSSMADQGMRRKRTPQVAARTAARTRGRWASEPSFSTENPMIPALARMTPRESPKEGFRGEEEEGCCVTMDPLLSK